MARARLCAEQHGLTLERFRDYSAPDGAERWRLTTDNVGHRLLPNRFDNPAAWHDLETVLRGAGRVFVLPESAGSLTNIERWLGHHCPPFTS